MANSKENSNDNKTLFFKYLGLTSPEPMGVEIESANGIYMYGPKAVSYIDLVSGVSVSNIGHAHPAVTAAIQKQAGSYAHLMVYGEFIQAPQVHYAALLALQLPPPLQSVYFVNSGSEAVEAALKLAKRVSQRRELIGFRKAYHGSTHGALSLIGEESFKQSFRPLLPEVRQLRFNNIEDLQQITAASAAVLVEPIQSEAGVILPEVGYLQALRERCTQTGTLLIFDEIQVGFGRSGKLFAFQEYGVIPDILCLAKALGGGMPLGAIITAPQTMKAWQSAPALGHITTFGGHPVCCAAGMAALRVLLESGWMEEVSKKEQLFRSLLGSHASIIEIRGKGLLLACELGEAQKVKQFVRLAIEEGVISDWFLFCDTAFRISPPLCITEQEIEKVCGIIVRVLDRL